MPGEVTLWKGVVGFRENLKVGGNKPSEPLVVSVGTATTGGVVTSARENRADMALKIPVVAEPGQRVAVSRRFGGKGRLIRDRALNRKPDSALVDFCAGYAPTLVQPQPAHRR